MPIARIAGQMVYFAHVPRCGGTSVEDYLIRRFGPLALCDTAFGKRPDRERWSKTSPQHIAAADLAHLFPPDFFAARFAMVRHPVARLKSVFRFQRDIEGRIGRQVSFEAWLTKLSGLWDDYRFIHDNHIRPIDDLVPEGARIFRLEDGFAPLLGWLDRLAGATAPDLVLAHKNDYAARVDWAGLATGPEPELSDRARAILLARYGRDFERFGYAPEFEE